jgi:hypothetical protein
MKSFAIFVLALTAFGSVAVLAQQTPQGGDTDKKQDVPAAAGGKKSQKKDETKGSNCKGGGQECPPHIDPAHTEEKRSGPHGGEKAGDECRHFFGAEVSADWAGGGFGAGDVDRGESEEQV